MAHGCYWKKCSFCDVSLDYISRYEGRQRHRAGRPHRPSCARRADRLSTFVDEAAPPKALKALAAELSARGTGISVVGQHPF